MFDKIEKIGKSIIQHGPNNDRIYLMKLHRDELTGICNKLSDVALVKRYTKIIIKVPEWALDTFLDEHYEVEVIIPGLYEGSIRGYFMAHYFGARRGFISKKKKEQIEITKAEALHSLPKPGRTLSAKYQIRPLEETDLVNLARIYREVFSDYPFPISQVRYLKKTFHANVRYFGAFCGEELVAASSAEIDLQAGNAELSDFATLLDHRGNSLSHFLLSRMEDQLDQEGLYTVYSIARATSLAMNKTFGRSQYRMAGTLMNNTRIGQGIESMNVWYKRLREADPAEQKES